MKNLFVVMFLVGTFAITSCEKSELLPSAVDEVQLKSASKVLNFRTHLSGENEPAPVWTEATGQAIFQLNKAGTELSYKLIVDDIENVTMSHIHIAPEGSNGPVAAWLYPASAPPMLISGLYSGILAEGIITQDKLGGPLAGMTIMDLVDQIYAGNAYVNVHTSQNPGGEIRGQISGNIPQPNK